MDWLPVMSGLTIAVLVLGVTVLAVRSKGEHGPGRQSRQERLDASQDGSTMAKEVASVPRR